MSSGGSSRKSVSPETLSKHQVIEMMQKMRWHEMARQQAGMTGRVVDITALDTFHEEERKKAKRAKTVVPERYNFHYHHHSSFAM